MDEVIAQTVIFVCSLLTCLFFVLLNLNLTNANKNFARAFTYYGLWSLTLYTLMQLFLLAVAVKEITIT